MSAKYIIRGLCLALICGGCACLSGNASDIASLMKEERIPEKDVFEIKDGTLLSGVLNTLGVAARHEFTILTEDGEYILLKYCVDIGQGLSQWLLFKNEILVKRPPWEPYVMEEVPYRGTTSRRRKAWDIEDITRVRKVIRSRSMTLDDIRADFESLRPSKRTAGEPMKILPALVLTWPLYKLAEPKYKRVLEKNRELRKRFDGFRAHIGMNAEQIDALYGSPLQAFSTKEGHSVRIYGDTSDMKAVSQVPREVCFSFVAVVFDAQGRVTRIFSDMFFDDNWRPSPATE